MPIRAALLALPFVVTRRINGKDGFFTAGRMFALLGERTLLLRLPKPATDALVEAERADPLVEVRLPERLAWVSIALPDGEPEPGRALAAIGAETLADLLLAAHQAVRAAGRRPRRERPSSRRRRVTTDA